MSCSYTSIAVIFCSCQAQIYPGVCPEQRSAGGEKIVEEERANNFTTLKSLNLHIFDFKSLLNTTSKSYRPILQFCVRLCLPLSYYTQYKSINKFKYNYFGWRMPQIGGCPCAVAHPDHA